MAGCELYGGVIFSLPSTPKSTHVFECCSRMLEHVGIHKMDMKWHTVWVLSGVQLHGTSAIWIGRESVVLGALLGT